MTSKPATAIADGAQSVVVTRLFRAPRALVWSAFTDPNILKLWLHGPDGWAMVDCRMDVRTGGAFAWRWRDAALGAEVGLTGSYLAVEPEARVQDIQHFERGPTRIPMGTPTENDVMFDEIGNATRVVTRITYAAEELRDQVLHQGLAEGMEQSYAMLDRLLPQLDVTPIRVAGAGLAS
ncbi:SRPBCC domain-containing protein [Gymnodinialimonas sp. 2305UL16-5]|uniref:SRPBCC domain-containing protein n=1 Tax=Gymnodinialimonas mytili TaxID=3126503 RepID=UPI0030B71CD2